jgi:polyribonucleotide nucleotidyltransferase
MEDHLGDMDFKVAGTENGITALQMDIKIKGITEQILKEALAQAKKARLEILKVIQKQIKEPRKEVSKYAPKMVTFTINPAKIKDVIGKGGEMITKIICEASNVTEVTNINAVKVELEDDGRVIIYHSDQEIIDKTRKMIEEIVREVEPGKIYEAKVVKVEDFGCFVQLWPGCEGLVHVSQLADKRVEKASDIVSVGDEIIVKALGPDKKGRQNFSRRDALPKKETKKKEEKEDK